MYKFTPVNPIKISGSGSKSKFKKINNKRRSLGIYLNMEVSVE